MAKHKNESSRNAEDNEQVTSIDFQLEEGGNTNSLDAAPEAAGGMTRRRFLRDTALGVAGAGAALTLGGGQKALAQNGGGSGTNGSGSKQTGTVEVDAVLYTILAAPLGSTTVSTLTLTETFTSTLSLSVAVADGVTLGVSSSATAFGVTSTSGESFTQTASGQVTGATMITTQRSFAFNSIQPGAGPLDKPVPTVATVNDTCFVAALLQKLKFTGSAANLAWEFINADKPNSEFGTISIGDLLAGRWVGTISATTQASWLAAYVPYGSPSATTLPSPQYKLQYSVPVPGGGSSVFVASVTSQSSEQSTQTEQVSLGITSSTGFTSSGLTTTFSAGNTITVTITGVQSISSTKTAAFQTVLSPIQATNFFIYFDKRFKCYVIISQLQVAKPKVTIAANLTDTNGDVIQGGALIFNQDDTFLTGTTDVNGNLEFFDDGVTAFSGTWGMMGAPSTTWTTDSNGNPYPETSYGCFQLVSITENNTGTLSLNVDNLGSGLLASDFQVPLLDPTPNQ
jgi:hypothetical protein